ncbi:MAG: hypothetical protein IPN06_02745 [Burkholderiales bacterium]|nr:hypothetical protein [Burkholderiales bacterium]
MSLARSADDTTTRALWSDQEIEKRVRAKRTLAAIALKTTQSLIGPVRALPQVLRAIALPGKTEAAIAFKTSKTVFNGHITASRRFAIQTLPMAETKEIGSILGHTVNDVFLGICATALRRYLADKNRTPALPLTATVPVSLRKVRRKRATRFPTLPSTCAPTSPTLWSAWRPSGARRRRPSATWVR